MIILICFYTTKLIKLFILPLIIKIILILSLTLFFFKCIIIKFRFISIRKYFQYLFIIFKCYCIFNFLWYIFLQNIFFLITSFNSCAFYFAEAILLMIAEFFILKYVMNWCAVEEDIHHLPPVVRLYANDYCRLHITGYLRQSNLDGPSETVVHRLSS